MAQIQTVVKPPGIHLDEMPKFQQEAMCRTIITGINRLFEDERYRADFEAWKKARAARRAQGGEDHGSVRALEAETQLHAARRAVRSPEKLRQ